MWHKSDSGSLNERAVTDSSASTSPVSNSSYRTSPYGPTPRRKLSLDNRTRTSSNMTHVVDSLELVLREAATGDSEVLENKTNLSFLINSFNQHTGSITPLKRLQRKSYRTIRRRVSRRRCFPCSSRLHGDPLLWHSDSLTCWISLYLVVGNTALQWIISYLQNRPQCSWYGVSQFQYEPASYGVPQGSVLELLQFMWRPTSRLSMADSSGTISERCLSTPPVSTFKTSGFGDSFSCVAEDVPLAALGAHETNSYKVSREFHFSRILSDKANVAEPYWPCKRSLRTSVVGISEHNQMMSGVFWDKENNRNKHPQITESLNFRTKRNFKSNAVCSPSINSLLMSPLFAVDDATANGECFFCNANYIENNGRSADTGLRTVARSAVCKCGVSILDSKVNKSKLGKKRRCSKMECDDIVASSSPPLRVTAVSAAVTMTSSPLHGTVDEGRSTKDTTIMSALSRTDLDLIGDFSSFFCLPTVENSKHFDLKTISCDTLSQILLNNMADVVHKCVVVDCRYPYEFAGGHIQDAINIYSKEDIMTQFIKSTRFHQSQVESPQRRILVFHCEFSSQRGPKLMHFLRNKDRGVHVDCYPSLYYPEMYLLDGGYKAFFECYQSLCVPSCYKPMLSDDHIEDLRYFRAKSKSWAGHQQPSSIRCLAERARSEQINS